MTILLIFLSGLCDRLRGAGFDFGLRIIDQLTYGWVIAALIGHPLDPLTPAIAIAFALGSAPGWGDSSGSILHRRELKQEELNSWQIGILRKNKWLSAIARGMIWGLPVALLGFFDVKLVYALVVMPVAYIGGAYLGGFFPGKEYQNMKPEDMSLMDKIKKIISGQWPWMETIRGWLAGSLFYLVNIGL